eukprot:UN12895
MLPTQNRYVQQRGKRANVTSWIVITGELFLVMCFRAVSKMSECIYYVQVSIIDSRDRLQRI